MTPHVDVGKAVGSTHRVGETADSLKRLIRVFKLHNASTLGPPFCVLQTKQSFNQEESCTQNTVADGSNCVSTSTPTQLNI